MRERSDDRAVAPVIGFILLFTVLILLLSVWQVEVVPTQNAGTEFEHQQAVTEDVVDLQHAVYDAPDGGNTGRTDVQLGTRYGDRTLYINPPDPAGRLRTIDDRDGDALTIRIENATAVDGEAPGVDDQWNGSTRTFNTSLVEYRPQYHELDTSPRFVAEHSVVYAEFDDRRINYSDQQIVEDRAVTLRAVGGDLDETGIEATEIVVAPQGTGVRSVSVTNESGPITLSFPTDRTGDDARAEAEWEGVFAEALAGNVSEVTVADGNVTVELDPNETYDLSLARVEVAPQPVSPDAEPAYVAVTEVDEQVAAGVQNDLTVEVRDRFDNPLAGEPVTLSTPSGNTTAETGRAGTATIQYTLDSTGTQSLTVTHPQAENVTVDVEAVESGGGTNGSSAVEWADGDEITVDQTQIDLRATSTIGDRPVTFAVEDTGVVTVNSASDDSFSDGNATATLDVDLTALESAGGVYAYVSSGGEGDRIELQPDTGGPPGLVSATVENAPLNQSDAGNTHGVTLEFNEPMNTSVGPTVGLDTIENSSDYNDSIDSNGAWTNDTVWESEFTLENNDEDVVTTLAVSDAEDQDGDTMSENTSNTFLVDTIRPGDPDEVRIATDPINVSNQNAVDVAVDVDGPDDDGGTVFVRLQDNDGNTVTDSASMQTGSGTVTTTVSGIDVSSLNDADPDQNSGVTATAKIVDDVDNENDAGFTSQSDEVLKDTGFPSIDRFELTNPSGNSLQVEIETNESLSAIDVGIEDGGGTVVTNLTSGDFSESENSGTYNYTASYTASGNDDYTAELTVAEDDAGNGGAGGETDTVTLFAYSDQVLQPVGSVGDELSSSDTELIFDIENPSSPDADVSSFSVNTTPITPGNSINDGNNPEVTTTGATTDGEADAPGNGNSFLADGTQYSFDMQPTITQGDGAVTVDMRSFDQRLDDGSTRPLVVTETPSDADVIVIFQLSNGDNQYFYFEQS